MRIAIIALAAAGSVAVAASAAGPAPSPLGPPPPAGTALAPGDCILVRDIRNHSVVDKNTLLLEVFAKGLYRVNTQPACFLSAVSADPITFRNVGKAKICKATDLGLVARGGYCYADSIVRLTPAEVAALPRRLRP